MQRKGDFATARPTRHRLADAGWNFALLALSTALIYLAAHLAVWAARGCPGLVP